MLNNEVGQPAARISLEFLAADPVALTEAWFQGDLQFRLTEALGETAAAYGVTLNLEMGEQHVDERLLEPAMSLFSQHPTGDVAIDRIVNRINTCFNSRGVATIRDLLATGREKAFDIRNLGKKGVTTLDAAFANQDFGVEWGPDPTPETIATMYKSFSEVPVTVLGFYPDSSHYRTVEDLLGMDEAVLAQLLASGRLHSHTRQARTMLATARKFASDFNKAKFGSAMRFVPTAPTNE